MTLLLHWSDLHTEFGPMELPDIDTPFDALLLGGDTGVGDGHLDFLVNAWEKYRVPVISIWGNHEGYRNCLTDLRRREDERLEKLRADGADIRILHGETTRVGDAVIFGATLWTDFELYPAQDFFSRKYAQRIMNDFHWISKSRLGEFITPEDTVEFHRQDRAQLRQALIDHQGSDASMVVMTHHIPIEDCVSIQHRGDALTPAFCSNLSEEIMRFSPDFWIFGHTHDGHELDIPTDKGVTRMRHNPKGYPREKRRPGVFDPLRVIDTKDPERRFL